MKSQTIQPQEQLPSFLKHFSHVLSFKEGDYEKENNADTLRMHREMLSKYAIKIVVDASLEGLTTDDFAFVITCQTIADAFEAMENELRKEIFETEKTY